ncbi:MAG: hypothetical protein PHS49_07125 [Candidatus Gracilibacteria bacterium]|nr:hypothetical protein [Candidatus Gracilibacteria bacterium]
MKKIIIVLLSILVLASCGSNKSELTSTSVVSNDTVKKNDSDDLKIEVNSTRPIFEERKVETTVKNGELTIGKNTNIKKGRSSDFPSEFPIIKGGEIYQNSNMQKYAFVITKDTDLDNIYKYYNTELVKKGFKLKKPESESKIDGIKNTNNEESLINLIFEKEVNNELMETYTISINGNIPKILKENLKLEGTFIEIYYS